MAIAVNFYTILERTDLSITPSLPFEGRDASLLSRSSCLKWKLRSKGLALGRHGSAGLPQGRSFAPS